jgi:hypothetical protein
VVVQCTVVVLAIDRRVVQATRSGLVAAADNFAQRVDVRKAEVPGKGHDYNAAQFHSLVVDRKVLLTVPHTYVTAMLDWRGAGSGCDRRTRLCCSVVLIRCSRVCYSRFTVLGRLRLV